ncbi:hypothetical protein MCOR27_011453 [Pyricularia oryzae]|uniref:Uncharacterized protein n=1 Tax=Pyricularia grisea TaxID=148305 RepID=A0ABQ8NLD0_PYRGI|nr:hypothetical protein MCOR01_006847 [Pyricularia oryzae]KAI6298791.1 hypothetical protein MCOR33_005176 [Pyricularia grisea]KAH9434596.1 hypothetical protein MCOR02_006591 [Pyricularia oryzae]KAI6261158.1 hypothetical protein MCOR19_002581 [Pyricularia oryzae]KAI6265301.1 hypothetical protein MCOR27_011453 [Pyricularia oryzae]
MRFFATLPFMATAVLGLATGLVDRADLPDGGYVFNHYDNGTVTALPLDTPGAEEILIKPIVPKAEPEAEHGIQKRWVTCSPGNTLDPAGVDEGVRQLKNWAGPGGRYLSSGDRNAVIRFISRGMMVYYCIDTKWWTGNLDIADIDYALRNMDSVCRRYTASHFQWDSPEIVGKADVNLAVCCGGGNC